MSECKSFTCLQSKNFLVIIKHYDIFLQFCWHFLSLSRNSFSGSKLYLSPISARLVLVMCLQILTNTNYFNCRTKLESHSDPLSLTIIASFNFQTLRYITAMLTTISASLQDTFIFQLSEPDYTVQTIRERRNLKDDAFACEGFVLKANRIVFKDIPIPLNLYSTSNAYLYN